MDTPLPYSHDDRTVAPEVRQVLTPVYFSLLSVSSFGLYPIWWIYESWQFFKRKDRLDIMPAARAIFSILFLSDLLNRIKAFSKEQTDYTPTYSGASLTAGFFVTNLCARLPGAFWLIALFSFVFLLPGVKAFNYALVRAPNYPTVERTGFNTRQTVLLLVGTLFWALIALGFVAPLLGLDVE